MSHFTIRSSYSPDLVIEKLGEELNRLSSNSRRLENETLGWGFTSWKGEILGNNFEIEYYTTRWNLLFRKWRLKATGYGKISAAGEGSDINVKIQSNSGLIFGIALFLIWLLYNTTDNLGGCLALGCGTLIGYFLYERHFYSTIKNLLESALA